jgi:hypothetical protein
MGVSLDDINRGVLDVGTIITNSMNAWNTLTGKQTTVATPPIAAPAVQDQVVTQPTATMGLSTGTLLIFALVALVLWKVL